MLIANLGLPWYVGVAFIVILLFAVRGFDSIFFDKKDDHDR